MDRDVALFECHAYTGTKDYLVAQPGADAGVGFEGVEHACTNRHDDGTDDQEWCIIAECYDCAAGSDRYDDQTEDER